MIDPNKNVLIVGIPRSGTTLLTAMLDSAPNTVSLNEPRRHINWHSENANTSSAMDFVKWFTGDVIALRKRLLKGEPVSDRRGVGGKALTNYFRPDEHTLEYKRMYEMVPITREGLTPDFTLVVKHVGLFLGVLEELVASECFRIITILRHPLGVIPSWGNVSSPVARGQMPSAVVHWKAMRELTARSDIDLLKKQVMIYDLACKRLQKLEENIEVMKYEDLVKDPMGVTGKLGFDCSAFEEKVYERKPDFYKVDLDPLKALISSEGKHIRHFYPE